MAFSFVKIFLIVVTVIVLMTGTFQGVLSYAEYCGDHVDDDEISIISDYHKRCHFADETKYTADVDFVAVVALSGVGALLWVSNKIFIIKVNLERLAKILAN